MGEEAGSRSMRWRLARSLLVFAGVGGAYAGLASLEEMTPPPDAIQLDDLAQVNNSKNGKGNGGGPPTTVATTTTTKATTTTTAATTTTTVAAKSTKSGSTTYTYDLSQPINSQLTISP